MEQFDVVILEAGTAQDRACLPLSRYVRSTDTYPWKLSNRAYFDKLQALIAQRHASAQHQYQGPDRVGLDLTGPVLDEARINCSIEGPDPGVFSVLCELNDSTRGYIQLRLEPA